MNTDCVECGVTFAAAGRRGPTPAYCSPACRQRAYRERARARATGPVFPERMTGVDGWVRADGKRPVMVDGTSASSTRASTWASYSAVQAGAGDGFGIMLGGGLGCLDVDNAVEDGRLKPWAVDVLEGNRLPVVFVEVSVSGRGLHVFVEAAERSGTRRPVGDGVVEFYSRGRFIRTTGDAIPL